MIHPNLWEDVDLDAAHVILDALGCSEDPIWLEDGRIETNIRDINECGQYRCPECGTYKDFSWAEKGESLSGHACGDIEITFYADGEGKVKGTVADMILDRMGLELVE